MTGDPASTLYNYADSISLDAQFYLVDTISGTALDQTTILTLCESAAASATCGIGDGATTSELELQQLLTRDDTIRSTELLSKGVIEGGDAGDGVTVSYSAKLAIIATSVVILGQGQTLDELAQNATETNERKITQLRDNTGLQGSVAFSSLIVFPASATIVAAETASDPASPIATTVRVALSAAALGLACAASASVRLAVAAAAVAIIPQANWVPDRLQRATLLAPGPLDSSRRPL